MLIARSPVQLFSICSPFRSQGNDGVVDARCQPHRTDWVLAGGKACIRLRNCCLDTFQKRCPEHEPDSVEFDLVP